VIHVEPPSWTGAAHARNLSSAALRLAYAVRVHGAHQVGTLGPLIMVCRSENVLTGSLLQATVSRPIHVIANDAMTVTLHEGVMAKAGIIPVHGPLAVGAQRQAVAALMDDRAVAVTGHALPVGYLVAATGAPVMAVSIVGAEGRVPTDPPRPRSRIDVYYSEPTTVTTGGDPLRSTTRFAIEERVRQLVADHDQTAMRRSGRGGLGG
jgi:hypothetical protein